MGPDWWTEAYFACEEKYGDRWLSMTDDERDQAVSDYLREQADVATIAKKNGEPR